ncbi:MAG: hypothetical protein Ct9H300mP1_10220 [Planctomycetaceae bacterium]|nr:MAG: hypothetical protein Ct9H300mP1_10220 [Planctomycetaceae bacterium]
MADRIPIMADGLPQIFHEALGERFEVWTGMRRRVPMRWPGPWRSSATRIRSQTAS